MNQYTSTTPNTWSQPSALNIQLNRTDVFNTTTNPFPVNGITFTCNECGHLLLYHNPTAHDKQSARPCPSCIIGRMYHRPTTPKTLPPPPPLPPLKPDAYRNNNHNNGWRVPSNIYNPMPMNHTQPHTQTNVNRQYHHLQSIPTQNKPKRKQLPPSLPRQQPIFIAQPQPIPIYQSTSKAVQHNHAFESPQKRLQYPIPQKHNTDYQQRQQKFQSLMRRQYQSYNKPLPNNGTNGTSKESYANKLVIQPPTYDMNMMKSTPNLHSQSTMHAKKKPQKNNIYKSQMRLKPNKPVLSKSHSNNRLLRGPHGNQVVSMSRPLLLQRAHSDNPSPLAKKHLHHTNYHGYPHRGPPLDFDKLLGQ
eukprot:1038683_1